ncbi:MAG: hypothetical protein OXU20_39420 [Myxococcales bacterium]|nr:hypothetical protein [Myxococcales bacterium]
MRLELLPERELVHIDYHVAGVIRIQPPGPPGAPVPAAVCLSQNSYQMINGQPVGVSETDRTGFVVCQIPPDGVDVPFEFVRYTTTGGASGLLVAAFLVSMGKPPEACTTPDATLVRVDANALRLLCAVDRPPPKSELALLAPYHDGEGQPADHIRIVATVAD